VEFTLGKKKIPPFFVAKMPKIIQEKEILTTTTSL
jgi:hypothetical protein